MDVLTNAVMGNYSELNPKDCGITRMTNGFDDNCFEWHKNPMPPLIGGRHESVPWMAHIRYELYSPIGS